MLFGKSWADQWVLRTLGREYGNYQYEFQSAPPM